MKTDLKILAAVVALMAVASCDEMPGGGNGDENGGNGAPIVNALPYVAPEDRIVAREEFGNFEFFEYNQQGLLTKRTKYVNHLDYDNGTFTVRTVEYTYKGLLVESKETSYEIYRPSEYDQIRETAGADVLLRKDDKSNRRESEALLNADGRFTAVSHYRYDYDFDDNPTRYLDYATAYTYNASGNLIGTVERHNGYTDTMAYTWENGNPKTIDYDGDSIYTFSFREEEYVWPGMNIYWDLDATDYYGDVDITGMDGMKFANLLHSVSATVPETGKTFSMEMVYTFDAKGRVKTVNSKLIEDGEEYYDADDAVVYYYGDETVPQINVPTYLVRQECIGAVMAMPDSETGSGSTVDPNGFKMTYHVKNIFSDGRETYSTCDRSGEFSFGGDPLIASDITRAELQSLRSLTNPETYVDLSSHLFDSEWIHRDVVANVVSNYPGIGDVVCEMNFYGHSDYRNPFVISLYDGEQVDNRYCYEDFTEDFLRSRIQVSCEVKKTNEGDNYETWKLSHHIDLNLWPDRPVPAERYTYHKYLGVPKE